MITTLCAGLELGPYLDHIKADYARCYARWHEVSDFVQAKYMIDEFNAGLRFEEGNKYIKVIKRHSVHSFIVKKDTNKFKRGDILKAHSWEAPATNFIRGNIFVGDFSQIRWTGVV